MKLRIHGFLYALMFANAAVMPVWADEPSGSEAKSAGDGGAVTVIVQSEAYSTPQAESSEKEASVADSQDAKHGDEPSEDAANKTIRQALESISQTLKEADLPDDVRAKLKEQLEDQLRSAEKMLSKNAPADGHRMSYSSFGKAIYIDGDGKVHEIDLERPSNERSDADDQRRQVEKQARKQNEELKRHAVQETERLKKQSDEMRERMRAEGDAKRGHDRGHMPYGQGGPQVPPPGFPPSGFFPPGNPYGHGVPSVPGFPQAVIEAAPFSIGLMLISQNKSDESQPKGNGDDKQGDREPSDERRLIVVQKVLEDTPAAKAGLDEGDVLVKINQQPVKSQEQVQEIVQDAGAKGKAIELEWRRGEKMMKAEVVPRKNEFNDVKIALAARGGQFGGMPPAMIFEATPQGMRVRGMPQAPGMPPMPGMHSTPPAGPHEPMMGPHVMNETKKQIDALESQVRQMRDDLKEIKEMLSKSSRD